MADQNEAHKAKQETSVVQLHLDRLHSVPNSGVVLDIYEFTNDAKRAGFIFYVNNQKRIKFGQGVGGDAKRSINGEKIHANFMVTEEDEQARMEDVIRVGSNLKHIGILKPMFTAYNCQISKYVSAFGSYDQSFERWLRGTSTSVKSGDYLISEEKEILATACSALAEMWEHGYTSDQLADANTYVMIGSRLKILPDRLHRRRNNEISILPLRCDLADLIDRELRISRLWKDPELEDFTAFLRNPNATVKVEDIVGHPILLTPGRRQIMYRSYGACVFDNKQVKNSKDLYNSSTMTINSPHKDPVLQKICFEHKLPFPQNAKGALDFAGIVSRHYVERLKEIKPDDWYEILQDDTVDKALRGAVPRLLSKRYALDYVKVL